MEQVIIFKGGRGNGGKDGVVLVSRQDGGNVFVHISGETPQTGKIIRFDPEIAEKVGKALISAAADGQ